MSTKLNLSIEQVGMRVAQVFNDGDLEDAKETLRECLMASHAKRVGRDDSGKIIYAEVPDYPIRLAAGIKILEWSIGRPVSRTIVADVSTPKAEQPGDATDALLGLLLAAPEAAADILEKLKRAAEKMKKTEPVDVTTTPALPEDPKPIS